MSNDPSSADPFAAVTQARMAERQRAITLAEIAIAADRPDLIPELLRSDATPAEARRRLAGGRGASLDTFRRLRGPGA